MSQFTKTSVLYQHLATVHGFADIMPARGTIGLGEYVENLHEHEHTQRFDMDHDQGDRTLEAVLRKASPETLEAKAVHEEGA